MGKISKMRLQAETTDSPVYTAKDLDYFQAILDGILDERGSRGSLSAHEREYLKLQLATAIFRNAESGERDYDRLKRRAIEAVVVPCHDHGGLSAARSGPGVEPRAQPGEDRRRVRGRRVGRAAADIVRET